MEKDIERRLAQGVKSLGGRAYKFTSPGNAGVPDRLVVLPHGLILFVELKTDTGVVSRIQAVQLRRLHDLGCRVCVVRGDEGVIRFLHDCEELLMYYADGV